MSVSTAKAISPDSGEHWAEPGAWKVAEGIHRIPLPLPMDGLKAVNVYAVETPAGLTLMDGGWAIPEGREALEKGLALIGAGVGDITTFLVTHAHRDHYTLASVLGAEVGAKVALGSGERATLEIVQRQALADPRLRFIANPDNPGFAVACNQGAADSQSPWLAFVNPDCFVEADSLARLRDREGYMTQVEAAPGGGFRLIENHCPICTAAKACRGFCQSEWEVFSGLMGPGATVTREEHILSGGRRCVYAIRPAGKPAKGKGEGR